MINAIQEQTRLRDAGVKDKVPICSLPSSKPASLISGSPSLDGFQAKPRELSTFPFHQYVDEYHMPFFFQENAMVTPWGRALPRACIQAGEEEVGSPGIALLTSEFSSFRKGRGWPRTPSPPVLAKAV